MRKIVAAAFGFAVVALAVAGVHSQAGVPWQWVEHTVATDLRGGYQAVAADLNKDGLVDLLAVATGAKTDLVWFENPLSSEARSAKEETWTKHVMAVAIPGMINAAAFDVDKDGIPEIALASGFATNPSRSAGVMTMLTHGPDVNAPWTAQEFDKAPTAHRLRWIDAEGNGRKVLINAPLAGINGTEPDYRDKVAIYSYAPGELKRQTVTDAEEGVIHGVQVVDWDGKGREALLSRRTCSLPQCNKRGKSELMGSELITGDS